MKVVDLTQGYFALVDDADFSWVVQWKWQATVKKTTGARKTLIVYAVRKKRTSTRTRWAYFSMAIELAKRHGIWKEGLEVDHKDGNRLNNQSSNLRMATGAENQANQIPRINTSSKYKGVSWSKSKGKWQVKIGYNYKKHHLGDYSSEEEAARSYDLVAEHLFGEFARLNFPNQKL